jgi:hypothetical protein
MPPASRQPPVHDELTDLLPRAGSPCPLGGRLEPFPRRRGNEKFRARLEASRSRCCVEHRASAYRRPTRPTERPADDPRVLPPARLGVPHALIDRLVADDKRDRPPRRSAERHLPAVRPGTVAQADAHSGTVSWFRGRQPRAPRCPKRTGRQSASEPTKDRAMVRGLAGLPRRLFDPGRTVPARRSLLPGLVA